MRACMRTHMEVGDSQRSVRSPDDNQVVCRPDLGVHLVHDRQSQQGRRRNVLDADGRSSLSRVQTRQAKP